MTASFPTLAPIFSIGDLVDFYVPTIYHYTYHYMISGDVRCEPP